MPLYEPQRHETLAGKPWDEGAARAAIERIAADARRCFGEDKLWPIHPLDWREGRPQDWYKALYIGAAGVIWVLDYLSKTGAVMAGDEYCSWVGGLLERNRADFPTNSQLTSYLMGDAGILLLNWKLAPARDVAQQAFDEIKANINNSVREFMWGAPGTMLAALFMFEWTAEERWKISSFETVSSCCRNWNSTPIRTATCGHKTCTGTRSSSWGPYMVSPETFFR